MSDRFAETLATYRTMEGAAAYVTRERKITEARAASAYTLLDGVELAGMRVLDVGCGYGRDVAEFRRRGAEAYGCDASPALLAYARAETGPYFADYDVRSGESVPFGGGFDLLWSYAVLVHVPRAELGEVLARLWDGLKVGGRLILATKRGEGESVFWNLGEDMPRVMVLYQLDEILAVLKDLGGEVERADEAYSVRSATDIMLAVRVRKV